VVAADINDPASTVHAINADGGTAIAVQCDVTDTSALQNLLKTASDRFGGINLICANAGSSFGAGTLAQATPDDMRRTLDLNVLSVLSTVQVFLPALKEAAAKGELAAIMVTGSEHSLSAPTTSPPLISYTTAKHALVGLVACARRDLADTGITVHLLCPGWVRTERLQGFAAQNAGLAQTLARYGQDPDVVAQLAFAGIERNSLVIPTNPSSRNDGVTAYAEILEALTALPIT
jgi:NAD(P)-dependent dehydrogenase (short-subunit alcohol dehydrogenase family)